VKGPRAAGPSIRLNVRSALYVGSVRGLVSPARLRSGEGQGTVEYGLLIAAGAIVVVVAMLFLAGSLNHLFKKTGGEAAPGVFRPPVVQCVESYAGVCIPPSPPDLNCSDVAALGIPLPVTVVGDDPHGLDPDGDGLGCD
jgi:Flp pilus assembly pilin Flp